MGSRGRPRRGRRLRPGRAGQPYVAVKRARPRPPARTRSGALNLARETIAARRARARSIARALARAYPDAWCALRHENPWQLIVATILSAQCTDDMVNRVTPELFAEFPTPAALAGASPARLEALCRLPGVGRKTANVVLGTAFGQPAIFVDTHVRRLSGRLGLTLHDDPDKIEGDLRQLLPPRAWTAFAHRLIHHGRRVCVARRPRCTACPLAKWCPRLGVTVST